MPWVIESPENCAIVRFNRLSWYRYKWFMTRFLTCFIHRCYNVCRSIQRRTGGISENGQRCLKHLTVTLTPAQQHCAGKHEHSTLHYTIHYYRVIDSQKNSTYYQLSLILTWMWMILSNVSFFLKKIITRSFSDSRGLDSAQSPSFYFLPLLLVITTVMPTF